MNTREIAAEYRLAHWAQLVKERGESGLSVKAFCERVGIHENSYYYWQKKLREAVCDELSGADDVAAGLTAPVFAEVKLALRDAHPHSADGNQGRVCVEAGGARITADGGYPEERLAFLVRAVMGTC